MAQNPWRGLAAYREPKATDTHTYLFCGRQTATGELASLIESNLFVTMYGRTGIGKTSLLEAGVFPVLRRESYVPVMVRFNSIAAGASMAEYIVRCVERQVTDIRRTAPVSPAPTKEDGTPVTDYLWEYFATRHFYADGREVFPVIVLDQFEENFLARKAETCTLLEQLYSLTDDNKTFPEGYHDETIFRIVLSIREDDLYRLEDCIDRLRLTDFKFNRYRLVQFTDDEAAEVVLLPGKAAGCLPASGEERRAVAEEIIRVVKEGNEGEINTLVLSLICSVLFDKVSAAGQPCITPADVRSLGRNPLTDFYLSIPLRSKARLFLEDRLVDANGRRNVVNKEEMDYHLPNWRTLAEGANRILQQSNGKVELVHDMLAKAIYDVRLRRERKRKSKLLQVSVLALVALCLVCSLLSSVFSIGYVDESLVPLFPKREVVTDTADYSGDKYVEKLVWKGERYLWINNCVSLRHIVIDGSAKLMLRVRNCPNLRFIDFRTDSLSQISIDNCPELRTLNIPRYVGSIIVGSGVDIRKVIPKDTKRYMWLDGALWDMEKKKLMYVSDSRRDSRRLYFPYECDADWVTNDRDTLFNDGRWIDNILFSRDSTQIVAHRSPINPVLDLDRYEKLKGVNADAFNGNRELKKLMLKDSADYGDYAFANCPNLDTIVIRRGVESLWGLHHKVRNNGKIFYVVDSTQTRYKTAEGIVMEEGVPCLLSAEHDGDYHIQGSMEEGDSLLLLSHGFYGKLKRYMQPNGTYKVNFQMEGSLTNREVAERFIEPCKNYIKVDSYGGSPFIYCLLYAVPLRDNREIHSDGGLLDATFLSSNTKDIYIHSSRFREVINMPDSLKRNITLHVPYGRLDDYLHDDRFSDFRAIEEMGISVSLWSSVQTCMSWIGREFKEFPVLIFISVLAVLLVGVFFFILSEARYRPMYPDRKRLIWKGVMTSLQMMLFAFVSWVAFYWFVWFTLGLTGKYMPPLLATLFALAVLFALYYNVLFVVGKVKWREVIRSAIACPVSTMRAWSHKDMRGRLRKWLLAALLAGLCLWAGRYIWKSTVGKTRYAAHVLDVARGLCKANEKEKALLILTDYMDNNDDYRKMPTAAATDSLFCAVVHELKYDNLLMRGQQGAVNDIDVSADGRYLASAGADGTVRLWELDRYACVDTIVSPNKYGIRKVAFSPDRSMLAYGDEWGTYVSYLNDDSGRILKVESGLHGTLGLAFNPKNSKLAVSYGNDTICLMDVNTEYATANKWKAHRGVVNDVCFSVDGQYLYSCSSDSAINRLKFLDGERGELREILLTKGADRLDVDGADRRIAIGGDKSFRIYDTDKKITTELMRGAPVADVCFSPDDRFVAVGYSSVVGIWDLNQNGVECVQTYDEAHSRRITSVCFSPDGKRLFYASEGGDICVRFLSDDADRLLTCAKHHLSARTPSHEDRQRWDLE